MSSFYPDDFGYSLRQRREDEAGDEYTVRFAAEDERRKVEHEAEFDFPYVTNGRDIERAITKRAKELA